MTGRKHRILALDDDSTVLGVIEKVLSAQEFDVATATEWVEAVEILGQVPPDLLLLDLQMPHVDGEGLLRWMREADIDIPVIVVSGYLDAAIMERLRALGVETFVWKPFGVSELSDAVDSQLGIEKAPALTVVPATSEELPVETLSADAPESLDAETDSPNSGLGSNRSHRRQNRRGLKRRRERKRTAILMIYVAIACVIVSAALATMRYYAATVEIPDAKPKDTSSEIREMIRQELEDAKKAK